MIVCGTGHRDPSLFFTKESLVNYEKWVLLVRKDLSLWLDIVKPVLTISGGAEGWDTWLFEEAHALKLKTAVYAPYPGQQYEQFKDKADEFKLISNKYHKRCFFDRDEAMVDASNMVLALLAPTATKGGTFYTRNYALDKRKSVANFWI